MVRGMMRAAAVLALLASTACVTNKVEKREAVVDIDWSRYPDRPMQDRKKVAVVDFEDKSQYGKHMLGRSAADHLANYLFKSKQFRIFDRQQLSKVLDEQKLGQSGIVDQATAARVGKLVGVEYVVYGVVANFGFHQEAVNTIIVQKKKQIADCEIIVRIIHVETGEIVMSQDGRGAAETVAGGSMGLGASSGYDQKLGGDALKAAIAEMMDEMVAAMP